jgi:hypothetical protein
MFPELDKRVMYFVELQFPLPESKQRATKPYPESWKSREHSRNGYFKGNFNIILPSTLRAVTWNVYFRCLVSSCICCVFLVCPLHVRQHVESASCFCIFCFPFYVSSVSETKCHPCFVKRRKLTIPVWQEKLEVALLYIREMLWEVEYPSTTLVVLEDGVTLSPIIEDQ